MSGHIRITHLIDDFCKNHCRTLKSAHASEAQHINTKTCAKQSARSPGLRTARYTSIQQAHFCALGHAVGNIKNDAVHKYQVKKETARMVRKFKRGRRAIAKANAYLKVYKACKDENKLMRVEEIVTDEKSIFNVHSTGQNCGSHALLNMDWEWRGKTPVVKSYLKTRDDECACVVFSDTNYKSPWCAYQDRGGVCPANAGGGVTGGVMGGVTGGVAGAAVTGGGDAENEGDVEDELDSLIPDEAEDFDEDSDGDGE